MGARVGITGRDWAERAATAITRESGNHAVDLAYRYAPDRHPASVSDVSGGRLQEDHAPRAGDDSRPGF